MPRMVKASRHSLLEISHIMGNFLIIQRRLHGFCGVISLTIAADFSLHAFAPGTPLSNIRSSTSSLRSSKSARLHSPRLPPAATCGSGVTASVHCGGMEQVCPSSKRSNHRLPARLLRLATQTPRCPVCGWKGWVTVTNCDAADEPPAFPTELQNLAEGTVSLAFGGRGDGPIDVSANGDVMGGHRLAAPDMGRSSGTCWLTLSY